MPRSHAESLELIRGTQVLAKQDIPASVWVELVRNHIDCVDLREITGSKLATQIIFYNPHNKVMKIDEKVVAESPLRETKFFDCSGISGSVPFGWEDATKDRTKRFTEQEGGQVPAPTVTMTHLILACDGNLHVLTALWEPRMSPEQDMQIRPRWFNYTLASLSLSAPLTNDELSAIFEMNSRDWHHPRMILLTLRNCLSQTATEFAKKANEFRKQSQRIEVELNRVT